MIGYKQYFAKKIIWFLITFVAALFLNFLLPRLMPGDPIASIMSRVALGVGDTEAAAKFMNTMSASSISTNRFICNFFHSLKMYSKVTLAYRYPLGAQ